MELGGQKGGLLCPLIIAETNREKKDSSSLLARTQPMKSHRLFACCSPPNFPFPSRKVFSSPWCAGIFMWLATVTDFKWYSLLNLNKHIFVGEIISGLFYTNK